MFCPKKKTLALDVTLAAKAHVLATLQNLPPCSLVIVVPFYFFGRSSFSFSVNDSWVDDADIEMTVYECVTIVKKREIGTVRVKVSDIGNLLRQNKMVEMWKDVLLENKVKGLKCCFNLNRKLSSCVWIALLQSSDLPSREQRTQSEFAARIARTN